MNLWDRIGAWVGNGVKPLHLQHGELGERAAKKYLRKQGLKFFTANFKSDRGEIDLIFRDGDGLVFVEVKTRSSVDWNLPPDKTGGSIHSLRQGQISFNVDA
ncbi:YraN family protein [Pedosphaera parvula]|uniref:YraN family protein n=1 Tax=Pedosphaera parvula (strain Ellin514) TaxID=320771 RepID=B9XLY1_PEDPL|nr:YraN family protein [Pedosphaera parvula]EEF59109.1 protein of unknown function UPF0102 [Pedosphaera parvula Ellin514]